MLAPDELPEDDRIRGLVRAASAGLVDEALAEAREEAKARLRSTLVDQILREISTPPSDCPTEPNRTEQPRATRTRPPGATGTDPSGAARTPRPDSAARSSSVELAAERAVQRSGTARYLYGFTDGSPAGVDGMVGIGGAPIEVVIGDGIGAVVSVTDRSADIWSAISDADADVDVLRPVLEAHERILEDLLDRGPVLPVRFGLTFSDAEDVRRVLRDHARTINDSLERVRDKSEWSVTLSWAVELARTQVTGDASLNSDHRHGSPAQRYIHRRQLDSATTHRMHELRARVAGNIHDRISGIACDSVVRRPDTRQVSAARTPIFKGAYLVQNRDQSSFHSTLEEELLAHRPLGVSADLTGPWPAYNFASLNLSEVDR